MRTKKALLNYLSEVIPQTIILILGFFKTKVFIQYLGTDMVGLFQVFNQLLYYLSLLDGGAGSIIGYHLYKPIKDNDNLSIGKIMSATIKFFSIIALAIVVLGLILDINIMHFITDTKVNKVLIQSMFLLILIANVLSYFYTPYTLLLDAKQERYKYNAILQPIFIIRSILEIALVIHFKSLLVVLIMQLIICIIQNIVVRFLFKKNYQEINLKEKPDFQFIKKLKDIIPHKLGSIIANNIDILIISKFIGVTKVVIYTSYYYITEVLQKFVDQIAGAVIPGVGNLLVTDKKKSYEVFKEYNELLFFIATIICVPLYFSISNFVGIWYGKDLVTDDKTVLLFVWLLFYRIIRNALNTFVNARGLFKETIKCTYLESIINLVLSLVLVHKFGIFGILLGTTIAYIVAEFLIKPNIINKKIFNSDNFTYYKDSAKYISFFIGLIFAFELLYPSFEINNILTWFINSFIIFIINAILVVLIYKVFCECKFFDRIKGLIKERFKK